VKNQSFVPIWETQKEVFFGAKFQQFQRVKKHLFQSQKISKMSSKIFSEKNFFVKLSETSELEESIQQRTIFPHVFFL